MIKMKNLERQQENLIALLAFAKEHEGISNLGVYELVDLFTKGSDGPLTRLELTQLTSLTQTFIRLPVYTTTMASAWLGVGIDTIRDAVWRHDPPKIKSMKPGHDVLVTHGELVRFLDNGN